MVDGRTTDMGQLHWENFESIRLPLFPAPVPCKIMSSCVTVHDNVAVAVIVSEVLSFEHLPFNVYQGHKSRPKSSDVAVVQRLC